MTHAASFIHDFQATGGDFQPDSLFVFALAPCCYRKALTQINKIVAQSETYCIHWIKKKNNKLDTLSYNYEKRSQKPAQC